MLRTRQGRHELFFFSRCLVPRLSRACRRRFFVSYATFPRRSPCNFVCPSHYSAVCAVCFLLARGRRPRKGAVALSRMGETSGSENVMGLINSRSVAASRGAGNRVYSSRAPHVMLNCRPNGNDALQATPVLRLRKTPGWWWHASLPNAGGVLLSLDGAPGLFCR